jgi:hypothetical protein
MTKEDLMALQKVIGDVRFMQAASLVASGMHETKACIAYMNNLARLDKMLGAELLK